MSNKLSEEDFVFEDESEVAFQEEDHKADQVIPDKLWNDEVENCPIDGLSAGELDGLVHELTCRRLIECLRDPIRCTPGLFQAALRFLKDNDITALPIPGSAQDKLRKRLGDAVPFKPKLTGT